MTPPTRTVLWQRLDAPGLEYAMVKPDEQGWLLQGDALTQIDGKPARVVYQVRVDPAWRTRRVAVDVLVGAQRYRLHLIHHARRGWRLRPSNEGLPHLNGCVDVDLGISPATNTLPIRRLALDVGEAAEITTAWIKFPGEGQDTLSVDPVTQVYTRVSPLQYYYERGAVGDLPAYESAIEVDELGLVTFYAGGWERKTEATEE